MWVNGPGVAALDGRFFVPSEPVSQDAVGYRIDARILLVPER